LTDSLVARVAGVTTSLPWPVTVCQAVPPTPLDQTPVAAPTVYFRPLATPARAGQGLCAGPLALGAAGSRLELGGGVGSAHAHGSGVSHGVVGTENAKTISGFSTTASASSSNSVMAGGHGLFSNAAGIATSSGDDLGRVAVKEPLTLLGEVARKQFRAPRARGPDGSTGGGSSTIGPAERSAEAETTELGLLGPVAKKQFKRPRMATTRPASVQAVEAPKTATPMRADAAWTELCDSGQEAAPPDGVCSTCREQYGCICGWSQLSFP